MSKFNFKTFILFFRNLLNESLQEDSDTEVPSSKVFSLWNSFHYLKNKFNQHFFTACICLFVWVGFLGLYI